MKQLACIALLIFMLFGCAAQCDSDSAQSSAPLQTPPMTQPLDTLVTFGEMTQTLPLLQETEDSREIHTLITRLFKIQGEQMADPMSPAANHSVFWSAEPLQPLSLRYYEDYIQLKKGRFREANQYASGLVVTLTFNSIELFDTAANVEVYVWMEFQYRSLLDDSLVWPSSEGISTGEGITYSIVMEKVQEQWCITSIDFYDESALELKEQIYNNG